MKEKSIFIFEAEVGMILSKGVSTPDGKLIASAGTILDMDLIERISDYHILEISIDDEPRDLQEPTYFERIRNTKEFHEFHEEYNRNISDIKANLNRLITESSPVDPDELIKGTAELIARSKNSLHLFDMLHCMREFDDITYVHSVNVALIASIIGKWMNYSEEHIRLLIISGLLHDIGKLMVPEDILFKPAKLSNDEFDTIKTHVSLGYNILNDKGLDNQIQEACLLHHERSDGSGYPFGLKSEKIPSTAKIIAIADVYDAMTSNRVYRGSICPFEVIKEMEAGAYNHFDPKYLLPFLNNVVSSYLHNNVSLSDGRIGRVIMINSTNLSKPIVECDDTFVDLSKFRDLEITAIL